jgi:ABC-type polysaccharide transport system permease subunit
MLLNAHSGARYLVLMLGVVVIAYSAYGMATKRPYAKTMRILASSFTGALDLAVLFGLAHLFTSTFRPQLMGHIVMMVLALAVAHIVSVVIRRRPLEQRSYAPHLVSVLIVLGLVSVGIMAIGRPIVG